MATELVDGDGLSDEIADEMCAVGVRGLGHDHRRSHTRARLHHDLDLTETHPIAPDLDFIIDAAQELQIAVGSPTGEVAGPVTPTARHALVGDEGGRGQVFATPVTAGQPRPADVELTGNAYGTVVPALVENQQRRVVDRLSDWDCIHRAGRGAVEVAHIHRRLGRPVEIHQPRYADGGEYPVEPLNQGRRERFPTAEHRVQRREPVHRIRLVLQLIHEWAKHRRHEMHDRHPISLDRGDDLAWISLAPRLEQGDASTRHRPPHQLPHRDVERHRGLLQNHVIGTKWIPPLHPLQPVDHRPVLDHHALGPTGRSRRVDDVRQVLRRCDRLDGSRVADDRLDATNTELIGNVCEFSPGHDEPCTAILEDRANANLWVPRIDRHVCGAGAQNSVDRNEQLGRARHDDSNAVVTLDTPGAQTFRDVVHGGIELPITERSIGPHHRWTLTGCPSGYAVDPHLVRNVDIRHRSARRERRRSGGCDPRRTACRSRGVQFPAGPVLCRSRSGRGAEHR